MEGLQARHSSHFSHVNRFLQPESAIGMTYRSHRVFRDLQLTQALETLFSVSGTVGGVIMRGMVFKHREERRGGTRHLNMMRVLVN